MGARINDRGSVLDVDTRRHIETAIDAPHSVPVQVPPYTVATVPPATSYPSGIIRVTDEAGGDTLAFSDGTDWLRFSDLTAIS